MISILYFSLYTTRRAALMGDHDILAIWGGIYDRRLYGAEGGGGGWVEVRARDKKTKTEPRGEASSINPEYDTVANES
jgi:hypothetical protein